MSIGPPLSGSNVGVGPALVGTGAHAGTPLVFQGGGSGGGSNRPVSYVYPQASPVSVIEIEHGLGFRPNVSLFNFDYSIEYAEFAVQHMTDSRLRVSMDSPTACVVVMS